MTTIVRDVMTTDLVTCPADASLRDAARLMRDRSIGDVLVTRDGRLAGIVTDRDIVVRCVADGAAADSSIEQACSSDLTTIAPDSDIDRAIALMSDRALRRLPVVEDGRPVGILSLGDLAVEREPNSALGDISSAQPNN
jgi:CBS domain-containing protein